MSAPPFPTFARQGLAIPPIVHENRYELECECARSLLAVTCAEQEGRLHMLTLLSAYLASGAGGRKRQFVAKEMQALRDLYEAAWCELGCAFSDDFARMTRRTVERQSWRSLSGLLPVHSVHCCRDSLGS
jgi:hypothetical protein